MKEARGKTFIIGLCRRKEARGKTFIIGLCRRKEARGKILKFSLEEERRTTFLQ